MDRTDELAAKLAGPREIAKADLASLHALSSAHGDELDEALGQQLARRIKSREIDLEDATEMIGNGYVESVQFKKEAVALMGRLSNVAPSHVIKNQIEKLIPTKKETIVTEAPQLTKEQIEELEREKESILRGLRAREPRREVVVPVATDVRPEPVAGAVNVVAADELEDRADPPAVALAEKALAQLEDEIRAEDARFKKDAADSLKAGITKRALMIAQRDAAAAAVKDARELAERESLSDAADRRGEAQQSYDQREQERNVVALAEVRNRVQPLLDRALVVQKDVIALFTERGSELERLGAVTWNSVPGNWDYRLRDEYGRQVLEPAKSLHREMLSWIADVEQRVLVEAQTVTTRFLEGHDWALKVNEVIKNLRQIVGDYVIEQTGRVVQADPEKGGYANACRKQILAIGLAAKQLERRAGAGPKPRIEIIIERDSRRPEISQQMKEDMLAKGVKRKEQVSGTQNDDLFE